MTKIELQIELRGLAARMRTVAMLMAKVGKQESDSVLELHATEMEGAADMADSWADWVMDIGE